MVLPRQHVVFYRNHMDIASNEIIACSRRPYYIQSCHFNSVMAACFDSSQANNLLIFQISFKFQLYNFNTNEDQALINKKLPKELILR